MPVRLLAVALAPAAHAGDPSYGLFANDMSHPAAQLAAEMDAHASTGAGVLREHLHGTGSSAGRASSTSPTATRSSAPRSSAG